MLQARNPERYPDSKKRTLQRRVQLWKAKYGEEQDVIFLSRQDTVFACIHICQIRGYISIKLIYNVMFCKNRGSTNAK